MIYLVIQKHCKFYGIVVIMSPGYLLEIISAGLLDTLNMEGKIYSPVGKFAERAKNGKVIALND